MIVKAQKKGVDIEQLVEKNNKLWKSKYEAAMKDYSKKMEETESKYK